MQKYIFSRRGTLVHSNPSVNFPVDIAFADEITLSLVEFEVTIVPEYILFELGSGASSPAMLCVPIFPLSTRYEASRMVHPISWRRYQTWSVSEINIWSMPSPMPCGTGIAIATGATKITSNHGQ
jgi:hypothetical protein